MQVHQATFRAVRCMWIQHAVIGRLCRFMITSIGAAAWLVWLCMGGLPPVQALQRRALLQPAH